MTEAIKALEITLEEAEQERCKAIMEGECEQILGWHRGRINGIRHALEVVVRVDHENIQKGIDALRGEI